ncbi:hypothetical protein H9649_13850 [Sporosarcina sp. Sa2YVA2]|uniref:Uncharacterized protein n=1 Tax=Sporosarcina quadrami TaxID=2762234 RepID=A0ABR8UCC4_9BACL|nr:hypothetical protein [Sporosarcina quadrami]MBD7985674.1 hypothetical protein [Sporosarcina quadrami]
MKTRHHSWKSYVFLTVSLVVTILMFLLDPIGVATKEKLTGLIILLILVGNVVSVLMGILTFTSKYERKLIPSIAAIFTFFNVVVVIFFFWFGANFA